MSALDAPPVRTPDRFLRRLVEGDEGRLAWFYDALMHMGPRQQRYVLRSGWRPLNSGLPLVGRWISLNPLPGPPDLPRTPFRREDFDPVS
jgi:hypothetical protein